MSKWMFELNESVVLSLSGERGVVIGRAEFVNSSDSYRVRYVDGNGCQQCDWFDENALSSVKAQMADKKPSPQTETVTSTRSGRPVAVEDLRSKLAESARGKK